MAKKNEKTIRELFVEVAEVLRTESVGREDLAKFIDGRVVVLDNKTASKKATAKQAENEEIKTSLLDVIGDRKVTVGELVKETGYSSQKLSALLSQMVKAGIVVREVEKKVALFSVA